MRYKLITILNTTYINVTIGFSFYTELVCVSKMLLKILYKYSYDLISIRHGDIEYIKLIQKEFDLYIRKKLLSISDEILFSSPTKCLKDGGIEYQKARLQYYVNRIPPEIIFYPKLKVKRKKKLRFKKLFNK